MDPQARQKRVQSLLRRAQKIREKAKEYGTPEKIIKATPLILKLNRRVLELVAAFIEDSEPFLEYTLTLPGLLNDGKIWTCAADDHRLILDKVVEIIKPQFEVVGTAANGIAALEMIRLIKPEVAVLDISMPYKTGIEIAAHLKENGSSTKVVILTTHHDSYYKEAAFSAGALGFVEKARMGIDLIPALNSARAGKIFISP